MKSSCRSPSGIVAGLSMRLGNDQNLRNIDYEYNRPLDSQSRVQSL